jgi:hypothetical protein
VVHSPSAALDSCDCLPVAQPTCYMVLMRQESVEQKTWVWSRGRPLCSQVGLRVFRAASANRSRPVEGEARCRLEAPAEGHEDRVRRQRATDIEEGASEDPSSWASDDDLRSVYLRNSRKMRV